MSSSKFQSFRRFSDKCRFSLCVPETLDDTVKYVCQHFGLVLEILGDQFFALNFELAGLAVSFSNGKVKRTIFGYPDESRRLPGVFVVTVCELFRVFIDTNQILLRNQGSLFDHWIDLLSDLHKVDLSAPVELEMNIADVSSNRPQVSLTTGNLNFCSTFGIEVLLSQQHSFWEYRELLKRSVILPTTRDERGFYDLDPSIDDNVFQDEIRQIKALSKSDADFEQYRDNIQKWLDERNERNKRPLESVSNDIPTQYRNVDNEMDTLVYRDESKNVVGFCLFSYIDKCHRKRGIGKKLYKNAVWHVFRVLKILSSEAEVEIEAIATNATLEFWKKQGFRFFETPTNDLTRMQKILTAEGFTTISPPILRDPTVFEMHNDTVYSERYAIRPVSASTRQSDDAGEFSLFSQ
eukprot:ANDGO_07395.mRNA.1 hypothetical protein